MTKALVSLSGGMDSATVLFKALEKYGKKNVSAVGFKYGSKHNPFENEMARRLAERVDVPFQLHDFTSIAQGFKSNLLLGGGSIPQGHYEAESMGQTVVPGRNLIFISILSGLAWSNDVDEVWLGIHSGDHHIYEDCRPSFFYSMNAAVVNGTGERVRLHAPYLYGNKTSIIEDGIKMGVPYDLTRTCYEAQEVACGLCGSCQERLEAWKAHGLPDPIFYQSRKLIEKE